MIKRILVENINIGTVEYPEFITEITLKKSFLFIKYDVVFRKVHGDVFRYRNGDYSMPSFRYGYVERYFETYC